MIRGLAGGASLVVACVVAGLALRGSTPFSVAFQNSLGIVGGGTIVVAFLMGGLRSGAVRRGADVSTRMRREAPASRAARVTVVVAGAVPLILALVLALVTPS